MKGFLIMLSVFLVTLSFVIAGEIYVKETASNLLSHMDFDKINDKEDFYGAMKLWEDKEKVLRFMINHKELEKITIDLNTAEVYFLNNDNKMFQAHLSMARIRISNLPEY